MTGTTLEREILKVKNKLIKKAQSKGLYENFGQKESRLLQDKFGDSSLILQFEEWASNFDLAKIKGGE